jgi:hypothetical protein
MTADRSQNDRLTSQELTTELAKARKRARVSSLSPSSSDKQIADPLIPLILQTSMFLKAWAEFDKYRREGKARKAWTSRAKEIALERCLKMGPEAAVSAIECSIMSGWTGIFEPNRGNNQNPKPSRRFDEFGLPAL